MFLPANQNKRLSLPLPKTRTIIFHILLFSRSFSSKIMFLRASEFLKTLSFATLKAQMDIQGI